MSMVVPRTEPAAPRREPLDPTYLAMAAAVMDAKGKFEQAAVMHPGKPNVKPPIPTHDYLKLQEKDMEREQKEQDTTTDERVDKTKELRI